MHSNIDPIDLQKIEKIIQDSDIITTILPVDLFDRHLLDEYEKHRGFDNKFFAMLDLCMFLRIIGIANNRDKKTDDLQEKNACALLAFLKLADVSIIPNHAIYEIMDSCNYEDAIDKLSRFRAFENLDRQILIELALGRRDKIPAEMLKPHAIEPFPPKNGEDFRSWKTYRGFVLKMAIIDLQNGNPFDKFNCFINWMYDDFIFMNAAVVFGSVLFSEKRFKEMLKTGIKEKDTGDKVKDKVLKGVRNATWDINLAYYWSQKAMRGKENGIFWLLCTEDNALRAVADSLIVTGDELEQKKMAMFCKYHGDTKGKLIYDKLVDMYKRKDSDKSRKEHQLIDDSDLYRVVDDLEEELLSELTKHK